MRPGSVIVDLAAESGGNCELSQPGVDVVHNDVRVWNHAMRAALFSGKRPIQDSSKKRM